MRRGEVHTALLGVTSTRGDAGVGRAIRLVLLCAWVLSSAPAFGSSQRPPTAGASPTSPQNANHAVEDPIEIVRQAVEKHSQREPQVANYTYLEHDEVSFAKHHYAETYEIMEVAGNPYERHVAHNDKPLPAGEQEEEDRKLKEERGRRSRDEIAEANPELRGVATYEERPVHLPLQQLPDWYSIRTLGEAVENGRKDYVLQATPEGHRKPTTDDERNAQHVTMKIWIDEMDIQITKIEAHVIKDGFINRAQQIWAEPPPDSTKERQKALRRIGTTVLVLYQPGTVITEEWTKINDEVWLPRSLSVKGAFQYRNADTPNVPVMLVPDPSSMNFYQSLAVESQTIYSDYKKFRVSSHVIP